MYDPAVSERGALLSVSRVARQKDPFDFEVSVCVWLRGVQAPCVLRVHMMMEEQSMHCDASCRHPPLPFPQAPLIIHTPHALPLFKDQGIHKRKRGEEERVKAASKKAPDPGKQAQGPGRAGKIGTTGGRERVMVVMGYCVCTHPPHAPPSTGTLLTQHLLKKHGMLHNPDEEQDVRAAILRHGNDQMFSAHTAAYAQTQPERILAQPDEDEDQEEGG